MIARAASPASSPAIRPAFTGVGDDVDIFENNPGGQCTSPEVVLAASTSCVPVASEPSADVPETFALAVPYPNPFRAGSGAVQVPFQWPKPRTCG